MINNRGTYVQREVLSLAYFGGTANLDLPADWYSAWHRENTDAGSAAPTTHEP